MFVDRSMIDRESGPRIRKMELLEKRFLSDAETSFERRNYPVVLSSATASSFKSLLKELSDRKSELLKTLRESGAILLRNCGMDRIAGFHQAMDAIGIKPAKSDEYYGEVVREQIEGPSRKVTL